MERRELLSRTWNVNNYINYMNFKFIKVSNNGFYLIYGSCYFILFH